MVDQARSDAIRAGLEAARARGRIGGRPSKLPDAIRGRIARERAEGRSLRQIAAGLNDDQAPTGHDGRQWWPSSVRAVLHSIERDPPT